MATEKEIMKIGFNDLFEVNIVRIDIFSFLYENIPKRKVRFKTNKITVHRRRIVMFFVKSF